MPSPALPARLSPFAWLPALLFLGLSACSTDDSAAPSGRLQDPADPVSQRIEEFTGGPSKLAWARYVGSGSDVFANFERLELWGIDTRDGQGIRQLTPGLGNYARPLITPDGSAVVFSRKGTTRDGEVRSFHPMAWRAGWDGADPVELGPGYAVDVWRDPATGEVWVYVTDLLPTARSSIQGSKMERFLLEDPSARELVYDQTPVSTENIQLSRDGKRASFLCPWPDAGVLDLETMSAFKLQHGCWPSLAPDNSYLSWVFDGAHKNLHFFTDKAAETWRVPVNTAPGTGGHEMYHPRWSNHPRYLVITGPYDGETVTRSEASGVEIFIGKFSEDRRAVADWLQVTDDDSGDFFPDLWIEGAEAHDGAVLASAPPVGEPATREEASAWPAARETRLFLWESRISANRAGENGARESGVEARERARFGPRQEMLTDGGHFEADSDSAAALTAHQADEQAPYSLEALATPQAATQDGAVIASAGWQLRQAGGEWVFVSGSPMAKLSLGPADPGSAQHLAVSFDGASFTAYRDGEEISATEAVGGDGTLIPTPPGLVFGAGWDGALEAVCLSAGPLAPEDVAASRAELKARIEVRPAIPRVRLRARLAETTAPRPVEALDTYRRGLLAYRYQVEEVLEGDFESDEVVVLHWTILDREPLSGFPREEGSVHELALEPSEAHPELVGERQWSDLLSPAPPWLDVSTPQP